MNCNASGRKNRAVKHHHSFTILGDGVPYAKIQVLLFFLIVGILGYIGFTCSLNPASSRIHYYFRIYYIFKIILIGERFLEYPSFVLSARELGYDITLMMLQQLHYKKVPNHMV